MTRTLHNSPRQLAVFQSHFSCCRGESTRSTEAWPRLHSRSKVRTLFAFLLSDRCHWRYRYEVQVRVVLWGPGTLAGQGRQLVGAPARSRWEVRWCPLQVMVGGTPDALVGQAPTHPPLLLHLLDVLDPNGAAAAGAKRTGLLSRGAFPRDNQGLWGEAQTQCLLPRSWWPRLPPGPCHRALKPAG